MAEKCVCSHYWDEHSAEGREPCMLDDCLCDLYERAEASHD